MMCSVSPQNAGSVTPAESQATTGSASQLDCWMISLRNTVKLLNPDSHTRTGSKSGGGQNLRDSEQCLATVNRGDSRPWSDQNSEVSAS